MFRESAISKKASEEIGILWVIVCSQPSLKVMYLGVRAESLFSVVFVGLFLRMCCNSLHMAFDAGK